MDDGVLRLPSSCIFDLPSSIAFVYIQSILNAVNAPASRRMPSRDHEWFVAEMALTFEAAGFTLQRVDRMYVPSTPRFAGWNEWGAATVGKA